MRYDSFSKMVDTGIKMTWAGLLLSVFLFTLHNVESTYKLSDIDFRSEPNGEKTRIYTASELKKYGGSDPKKPLLMAVRGVVFDVTEGKDFYGKGAAYNALAGKDASRAIALWSLEEKDLTHDLTGLSDRELKGLDEVYIGTYKKKYPVVGYMDYLVDVHAEEFEERFTKAYKEDL